MNRYAAEGIVTDARAGGTTWGFVRAVALRKKAERIVAVEREA